MAATRRSFSTHAIQNAFRRTLSTIASRMY
jgi:hypothetical protein